MTSIELARTRLASGAEMTTPEAAAPDSSASVSARRSPTPSEPGEGVPCALRVPRIPAGPTPKMRPVAPEWESTCIEPVDCASTTTRAASMPLRLVPSITARVCRLTSAAAHPPPVAAAADARASVLFTASKLRLPADVTVLVPPSSTIAVLVRSTDAEASAGESPVAVACPRASDVAMRLTSPLDRSQESTTRTTADEDPRTVAAGPCARPVVAAADVRVIRPPRSDAPDIETEASAPAATSSRVSRAANVIAPSPPAPRVSIVLPDSTMMCCARISSPAPVRTISPMTVTVPCGEAMTMRTKPDTGRVAVAPATVTLRVPLAES